MKQYIYSPTQLGLAEWPDCSLRLQGIEVTENPEEADVFVVPPTMTNHKSDPNQWMFPTKESLYRLPFMKGNESRHVFMDGSDNAPLYGMPCIFIRQNTRDWYLAKDPNTISWPWPVGLGFDDFVECIEVPAGGFSYDVSFHGWTHSDATKVAVTSITGDHIIKSSVACYSDFTGYCFETTEGIRRRKAYAESLKTSRVSLCPESIPGVFRYRFYEAMAAARVPFLIGTGHVFPFADEIPYREFIIEAPTVKAGQAAMMLKSFLAAHDDSQIIDMGRKARHYWETYLNRANWPRTMAEAVRRKVAA